MKKDLFVFFGLFLLSISSPSYANTRWERLKAVVRKICTVQVAETRTVSPAPSLEEAPASEVLTELRSHLFLLPDEFLARFFSEDAKTRDSVYRLFKVIVQRTGLPRAHFYCGSYAPKDRAWWALKNYGGTDFTVWRQGLASLRSRVGEVLDHPKLPWTAEPEARVPGTDLSVIEVVNLAEVLDNLIQYLERLPSPTDFSRHGIPPKRS